MKIIVTGGAGFIGSAFVRAAEAAGHHVTVLDKLTYAGRIENLHATRCALHRVDICDPTAVHQMFAAIRPHAVVHFAAESHVDASFLGRRLFMQVNAIGTDIVMEAAREYGVQRAVHISTDEVFGNVFDGRMTEEGPIAPRNPYAASKAAAEMVVMSFRETYNYPIMMVRLSNCYGPRQHHEKLIPLTISRIMNGEPALIHSNGKQTREWLAVDDAAQGVLTVLEHGRPGLTYNLPGTVERTVEDVVKLVASHMPELKPLIRYEGDRPGGTDRRYCMSGLRARSLLRWSPSTPFEQGIAATVTWYRSHTDWLRPKEAAAPEVIHLKQKDHQHGQP